MYYSSGVFQLGPQNSGQATHNHLQLQFWMICCAARSPAFACHTHPTQIWRFQSNWEAATESQLWLGERALQSGAREIEDATVLICHRKQAQVATCSLEACESNGQIEDLKENQEEEMPNPADCFAWCQKSDTSLTRMVLDMVFCSRSVIY